MNRDYLEDVLRRALDQTTEGYQTALSRVADLPPDHRDMLLDGFLCPPVEDALRREPEFTEGYFIYRENGGCGFGARQAAELLVSKARRSGSIAAALDCLQKNLATSEADGYCVMALWGISTDVTTTLVDGIELMPVGMLPESERKQWLLSLREKPWDDDLRPPSLLGAPEVALLHRTVVRPYIRRVSEKAPASGKQPLREYDLLDDVRRALTVVGPCTPMQAVYWFHFADPDLEAAARGAHHSYQHHEVAPMVLATMGPFDPADATRVVRQYLRLSDPLKAKVSLALDRLNQAMRRCSPGDQALDVCIALEALLSDGQGENTFKVGLRAALLSASDPDARRRARAAIGAAYKLRSAVVHDGVVPEGVKVAEGGKQGASDVAERAMRACANVIRSMIDRGAAPDWYTFELHA
jgi:hypothetical protein